MAGGKPRFV